MYSWNVIPYHNHVRFQLVHEDCGHGTSKGTLEVVSQVFDGVKIWATQGLLQRQYNDVGEHYRVLGRSKTLSCSMSRTCQRDQYGRLVCVQGSIVHSMITEE